jgi:hypothetical protein
LNTAGVPTRESLKGKVDDALLESIFLKPSVFCLICLDPGINIHGMYDLIAVLTHVGRSADAGHYMAWVRQDDSDDWWKFDGMCFSRFIGNLRALDDKVTAVKSDDILKLVGGGMFVYLQFS